MSANLIIAIKSQHCLRAGAVRLVESVDDVISGDEYYWQGTAAELEQTAKQYAETNVTGPNEMFDRKVGKAVLALLREVA